MADSSKAALPIDPGTQRPFVYRPHGLNYSLGAFGHSPSSMPNPGEAFLWSPSYYTVMQNRSLGDVTWSAPAYERIFQGTDEHNDYGIWSQGTFFRLGRPVEVPLNEAQDATPSEIPSASEGRAKRLNSP